MNQSVALPSQRRLPRPCCGSAAPAQVMWSVTHCSWTADIPLTEAKERQGDKAMRGAVLYGPRDVRFEERPAPTIIKPTDAIIRMALTCVCGSDLWDYRGAVGLLAVLAAKHRRPNRIIAMSRHTSRQTLA